MNRSKILVADDNESIRDMIKEYLEEKGFTIITAVNGTEAVAMEEKLRPDLVILDVVMPVMDGFEACKIIRERRSGIHYVPILFLSGALTEGTVVTGLQAGGDDYIRKPFELPELLGRINSFMKIGNSSSRSNRSKT